MDDLTGDALLKRALSHLEQHPEELEQYRALQQVLWDIARSRRRTLDPGRPLSALRALVLGAVGIARGLVRMSVRTWVDIGIELTKRGLYAPALLAYDAALAVDPECTEAWFNKGIIFMREKWYEQALAAYCEASRLRPDAPDVAYNMGGALSRLGRYEEALAAYDRVIQHGTLPPVTPARDDGLLAHLERRRPDCADAWFNRAVVLTKLGRDNLALAAYDEALRLKPGFMQALANRKRLARGPKGAKVVLHRQAKTPEIA